jgi:Tfp pilus assembly protein PilZ
MTVAFEDSGEPVAYGAVANLSESGACVWTAELFNVGEELSLRLSGAREPQPLQAPALVVWGAEDAGVAERAHRYGLKWVALPPEYRSLLRRLAGC